MQMSAFLIALLNLNLSVLDIRLSSSRLSSCFMQSAGPYR
jgi:hypothetical protein